MINFLVGLLVVLFIIIALLGGMFMAGMVVILGIAVIFLFKIFVFFFIIMFFIWLIGKLVVTVLRPKQ